MKVSGTIEFWKKITLHFKDEQIAKLAKGQLNITQDHRSTKSKGSKHPGYVVEIRDNDGIIDVLDQLKPLLRNRELLEQTKVLRAFCTYQKFKENNPRWGTNRFGKYSPIYFYHTKKDINFCQVFARLPKRKKTGRAQKIFRLKDINGIIYVL